MNQGIGRNRVQNRRDAEETLQAAANRIRPEFRKEGQRVGVNDGAEEGANSRKNRSRGWDPTYIAGKKRQEEYQKWDVHGV